MLAVFLYYRYISVANSVERNIISDILNKYKKVQQISSNYKCSRTCFIKLVFIYLFISLQQVLINVDYIDKVIYIEQTFYEITKYLIYQYIRKTYYTYKRNTDENTNTYTLI